MKVTRQQAANIAISIVEEMRDEYVPRHTGNMAHNALQYEIQNDILAIYINPDIAPYVPIRTSRGFPRSGKGRKTQTRVGGIDSWQSSQKDYRIN